MSKSSIEFDPNDNNKFYYNGIQYNASDTNIVPAEIDTTLQTPLFDHSHTYEVSVVRLFVSGNTLPIFIVPVLSPDPPYTTKYVATLSYNGFIVSRPVIYTPENNVNKNFFNNDAIFYIYTYQHWLDNINRAYLDCYNQLVTDGSGIELVATSPPIFVYDTNNNLISYYVESSYETNGGAGINIFMNKLLFDFFTSFESVFQAELYQNVEDTQLIVTNTNATIPNLLVGIPPVIAAITPIAPYVVWKIQQEYASVSTWNSIRSLVLTSNIGTIGESIPNVNLGFAADVSRSNLQILTDFDLDFSSSNRSGGRLTIQYLPTAEYRWSTIVRAGALSRINVKVQYLTFRNEIKNLYINPNFTFSIKLLFRKKVQAVKL
jgi:hypothetical protein